MKFCCECGKATASDDKLLCSDCWLRIFGKAHHLPLNESYIRVLQTFIREELLQTEKSPIDIVVFDRKKVQDLFHKTESDIEHFAKPLRDYINNAHFRGDHLVALDYTLMKIDALKKVFGVVEGSK